MDIIANSQKIELVGDCAFVIDGFACSKAEGISRTGIPYIAFFEVPDGEPANIEKHLKFVEIGDSTFVESRKAVVRVARVGNGLGVRITDILRDIDAEIGDTVEIEVRKVPKTE